MAGKRACAWLAAFVVAVAAVFVMILSGCSGPAEHRRSADDVAAKIISQKQQEALGRTERFGIERPSDILRRRLLIEQDLLYLGSASLGSDALEKIRHWPELDYPAAVDKDPKKDDVAGLDPLDALDGQDIADAGLVIEMDKPLELTLLESLQIGAQNSFEYQTRKEQVFQKALALDLERDEFRHTFTGQVSTLLSTDLSGEQTVTGVQTSGDIDWSKKLESGAQLSTALGVDLANLLTMGGASSLGITADASVSIPLLRGSGRHIVTESLTQAERNMVYEIYEFERFKHSFAVEVAKGYLAVLRALDQLDNAQENYRGLVVSARRARRLGDAGRQTEIQVDQAVQDELRARNRWITATESYKRSLDSFKNVLGLPPDSRIDVDRSELSRLVEPVSMLVNALAAEDEQDALQKTIPPADAEVVLEPPSRRDAGPFELEESLAIALAMDNRLDLKVSQGRIFDAQRAVVIAADALGPELTLFGSAGFGSARSIGGASQDDAKLLLDKGRYSGLLTFDPAWERTRERNDYRNSLIEMEQAVRNVQMLEDQVKLTIRNKLRDMLESRESLQIQAKAVTLAEKRVKSINLFMEAGRAQMRDLLEAQEALLSAQNSLTSAVVNYRVAELELQRDIGLLQVEENGLWKEFSPEEIEDAG